MQLLCENFDNRLGVPAGVEIIVQGRSDCTAANVPLMEEEGNAITPTGSLSQFFPGGPRDFQLLACLCLILLRDLVVGLYMCTSG